MSMIHTHRGRLQFAAGLSFWLLLAIWAISGVLGQTAGKPGVLSNLTASLVRWATGASCERRTVSDGWVLLAANDPVVLQTADGQYVQIGSVRSAFGPGMDPVYTRNAVLRLDRDWLDSACPHGFQLEYHSSGTSLDSVVQTLFSPERRRKIAEILARDWQRFGSELMVRMEPVIRAGAARFATTVESELPGVLERRREDLATLADRYQTEIVRQKIVPLVRQEVLPIVEEEIRPAAMLLGRELWDRVSLWSFTWRYLYDLSPLPERNHVKREFERFLENEIRPALAARTDDFVKVTERVVARISRNEQVRNTIRESLRTAAADPQLQKVILDIFREAVVDNKAVQQAISDWLQSPDVRELLQLASTRFEPTVREIGDLIFGSRQDGISPEFARVLRTQILLKDRRWLMLIPNTAPNKNTPPDSEPIPLQPATTPQTFPLRFQSSSHSPLTAPPPAPIPPPPTNPASERSMSITR